jgi:uncharacterized protein
MCFKTPRLYYAPGQYFLQGTGETPDKIRTNYDKMMTFMREGSFMLEETMLEQKTWAVVGANQNPDKYGNMIYRKLKRRGYTPFAVNPRYDTIEGDPCYPDLSSVPEKIQVVNMVVNPRIGKKVIEEAARLRIPYIWFQPGTYSDELGTLAKQLGLEFVQACALVATR